MSSVWKHEDFEMVSGRQENYQIVKPIGNGSYGKVFLGAIQKKYECVIKVFNTTNEAAIKREVYFLGLLEHKNIVKIYDVIQNETFDNCIILEYVHNTPLYELSPKLTLKETKIFFMQLLKTIHYLHSNQVMHRDIKPSNIMFDYSKMNIKLIDFGLADYYKENNHYTIHVGSTNYKAPELLLHIHNYTPTIDLWSCGCVLSEMIIRKHPLFHGECPNDVLEEIIKLKGTVALTDFIRKEQIKLTRTQSIHLVGRHSRSYDYYTDPNYKSKQTPGLLRLLKDLLEFNYHKRPTSSYINEHLSEYFN